MYSDKSFFVYGIDVNKQVLRNIMACNVDLNEPSLGSLLKKCLFTKSVINQTIKFVYHKM